MRRQIRWQMVLPYLALLVVIVVILNYVTLGQIRQRELAIWQDHLFSTTEWIAAEASPYFLLDEENLLQLASFSERVSSNTGFAITFLDLEGNTLTTSFPFSLPVEGASSFLISPLAVLDGEKFIQTSQFITAAALVRAADGEAQGIVQLHLPQTYFRINFSQTYWLSAGLIVVGSLGVVLILLFYKERSLKSIEMLTITAQQMSMGDFRNLEFPPVPEELRDLSETIQLMAENTGEKLSRLILEGNKLQAVLNQMTDGVLIADVDGRVQMLNPAAERLFQIAENDGLGRSVVEVLRYHQLVDLWRVARDGERQSTMLEIGPNHLFLQVVAIPLKTSQPGSTMILVQDLTQLRRLETVRRDFISNVSHELRTPLASLRALAETLQEGALDDPPAARRFILLMETEIDNLTQLVNELLELSRIESGKVPLTFHRIFPGDLIQPAYDRMVLQAERAGLELILDYEPELPAVFADPDRITQVLINLIHNAIKFTPPDGKIIVSAYRDGDHIVFFVRDTGVGIIEKDLRRIFERFYKADQARAGGGTGLGLSIARHMVESHGGNIWAEGKEGVGSTFYFSLYIA